MRHLESLPAVERRYLDETKIGHNHSNSRDVIPDHEDACGRIAVQTLKSGTRGLEVNGWRCDISV